MDKKVNNVPEYAKDYKYIVCTTSDKELWFWGAYNDFDDALQAARERFGVIIEN